MKTLSGLSPVNRLVELVFDWRFLIRREGWQSLFPKVRATLRSLPYRRLEYIVMAVRLDQPLPTPSPRTSVEVRPFRTDDLDFVCREYLPSEAAMCRRRLAAEQEGLTAVLEGEVVGYAWLCRDDALERIDLPMRSDELMLTDAFTAPNFRGRGVSTGLALAALRRAKNLHYRRLLGYIETGNMPSLTVWLGKMKGEVIERLVYERVWARRRTRKSAITPPGGIAAQMH